MLPHEMTAPTIASIAAVSPYPREKHLTTNRAPYVAAVAGAVVALAVFGLVLALVDPARRSDLLFELAKSAIGVLPLAFFGVIVADMIRRRDTAQAHRREDEGHQRDHGRALDEYRRGFRADVIGAYNDLKAARRVLRGAGLAPPWRLPFTSETIGTLDQQFHLLIRTQLTFERLKREMQASSADFTEAAAIREQVTILEKYVNEKIKEWEHRRPELDPTNGTVQLKDWAQYAGFNSDENDGGDFNIPADAMRTLETAVIADLRIAAPTTAGS